MAKRKKRKTTIKKATKRKTTKKKTTKKKATKKTPTKKVVAKPKDKRREVNWVLAVVMSAVLGQLGVDRFIMGHIGWGILKLITLGGFGIWWLIDLILIATKHEFKGVKWVD